MLAFDDNDLTPLIPEAAGAVWLIGAILLAVLFLASLLSILFSPRYTGGGKLLWIIVVFTIPLLAPIWWFLFGRRARIRTEAP